MKMKFLGWKIDQYNINTKECILEGNKIYKEERFAISAINKIKKDNIFYAIIPVYCADYELPF